MNLPLRAPPVAAGAPPVAAPARAPEKVPLLGFFRYHGIWAPGLRLFRSVGFHAKAWIIGLTFVLPLLLLSWNYFSAQAALIGLASKERLGVAYVDDVMPLLQLLQRQRLLAGRGAGGDAAGAAAVAAAAGRLAQAENAHGAALHTARAYAAWRDSHAVSGGDASANANANANAHAAAAALDAETQALLHLVAVVGDTSHLTLDPQLDTNYLMDAALVRLPAMLEAAAQLRSLGATVLAAGSATPAQSRRLVELATLLNSHETALSVGIAKAAAVSAEVRAHVDVAPARDAVRAFAAALDRTVLRGEGVQGDAAAHDAAAAPAIDAMFTLAQRARTQLDALIVARVGQLESQRNVTALVLGFGLLTSLYLFVSFGKVLGGGLREVAVHIEAMRDGNLTTRLKPWGNDEAARLMQTLAQMQQSLRRIVSQVRGAADGIVGASTQIADGARDLSSRTDRSAAHLLQTAAAMEQIAATVKRGEDTLDESARLASANAEAADRGGRVIGDVVQTMQHINEASGRIADIVGTIDGIAFQTNILALNAAVEAARAGEQGRGFAVVASEVRALAQRSSLAAREIKTLISASVARTEDGVRIVQEAGSAIGEIVSTSQRVRGLLAEVAVGAREQTAGVAQSARAVHELDAGTQQNAALVQQTVAAAGALKQQAHALAHEVAQFKLPPA